MYFPGRAHLRESLVLHEEAQRLQRMCRELKSKQALAKVLQQSHQMSTHAYSTAENEDDFREVLDPPRIQSATKLQLNLTGPDFAQYKVEDLFKGLGPVAIFSAKHHWTAPRLIQLHRGGRHPRREMVGGEHGFGFSVRGDAPVIIAAVDNNSLADVSIR